MIGSRHQSSQRNETTPWRHALKAMIFSCIAQSPATSSQHCSPPGIEENYGRSRRQIQPNSSSFERHQHHRYLLVRFETLSALFVSAAQVNQDNIGGVSGVLSALGLLQRGLQSAYKSEDYTLLRAAPGYVVSVSCSRMGTLPRDRQSKCRLKFFSIAQLWLPRQNV